MKIKKGDFIELDYTGKLADDNKIFDTTIQKTAEDAGLLHKHEEGSDHDHSDKYKPIIVCVGENHLLPGLDQKVEGKEPGKHSIELKDIEAFGKKDAKLITMIPSSSFKKHDMKPFVGLELNIDGKFGVVRSVSAGRVLVDFNHPLASKNVIYDVDIKKILTDDRPKLDALMEMVRIPHENIQLKDKKATIQLKQIVPDQYLQMFCDDVKRLTGITIEFKKPQEPKKEEKKSTDK